MTIPADNPKVIYDGNDAATNFPYTFKIFSNDDMQVLLTDVDDIETLLTEGVDYNITGAGDPNGGAVTYPVSGSPLATGEKLTLDLEPPFTQSTDLNAQGAASPLTIENTLDYLTQLVQSLNEMLGRAIVIPKSYNEAVSLELPVPAASKFLAFNAAGDALILVDAGNVTLVTPGDDTVSTIKIQDLAVTTAKINDLAVTQAKIAAGSIDASKIDATDLVAILTLLDAFNKLEIQKGQHLFATAGGTADAITVSLTPTLTAYGTGGMRLLVLIASDNTTTTPTIDVDGIAPQNIVRENGVALEIGDLAAGYIADLKYDGTEFVLQNPHVTAIVPEQLKDSVVTTAKIADQAVTEVKSGIQYRLQGLPDLNGSGRKDLGINANPIALGIGGAVTDGTGADGRWSLCRTDDITSSAYIAAGAIQYTRTDHEEIYKVRVKTDTSITDLRLGAGLADDYSLFRTDGTPDVHGCFFRYEDAIDGTAFWRCVSTAGTGASAEETITTQSIVISTEYDLEIRMTATEITFYINKTLVATHNSVVPAPTTGLEVFNGATSLSNTGAARGIYVGAITITNENV